MTFDSMEKSLQRLREISEPQLKPQPFLYCRKHGFRITEEDTKTFQCLSKFVHNGKACICPNVINLDTNQEYWRERT